MRILGNSLVFGFSIALSMWCVWFVTHFPGVDVAPTTTGALVLVTMVAGGVVAGRYAPSRRGAWRVGALSGFIVGCINLLVLGSYLAQPHDDQALVGESGEHALTGLPAGEQAPAQAGEFPAAPEPASGSTSLEMRSAPAAGLRPAAGLILLGFVVLSTLLITGAVMLGRLTQTNQSRLTADGDIDWFPRFAIVTAVTIAPLLFIGALVTSTGSGMAVPDWPRTYGANMFLYPIGLMTRPRILLEHAHRLFGSLAGLTTMVLMVYTLVSKQPRWAKMWSVGLFVLVVAQGVIGGERVNNKSIHLALVHGVAAQLFFGLTVAFAVAVNPFFGALGRAGRTKTNEAAGILDGVESPLARRAKLFATGAMHSLILQLILGATYRHLRVPHALWAHMAFALVVMGFVTTAGYAAQALADRARDTQLRRTFRIIGIGMVAAASVQFLLGWATWWVVQSGHRPLPTGDQVLVTPQVSTIAALLPTLHQANGALLLAFTTLAYVWSMRLRKATVM